MKRHIHKAIKSKSKDRGWNHCVSGAACAANPARQNAHGNITTVDVCSCGAVRESESNGGRTNYGPWITEGEGTCHPTE